MLKDFLDLARDRADRLKAFLALRTMIGPDEFEAYVVRAQPAAFLRSRAASPLARRGFRSVVAALGIELAGARFLDLGPGHGDALDVCAESGGVVEFVEPDPCCHAFNRLKGYRGHRGDPWTGLGRLSSLAYDVVWTKGALPADRYIDEGRPRFPGRRSPALSAVLEGIERVAAKGCHIVVCPCWRHDGERRRVADVLASSFTREMRQAGYAVVAGLASPGENLAHPLLFHKRAWIAASRPHDPSRREAKVLRLRPAGT